MEYKITIEKLTPRESTYPMTEKVYEQVVDESVFNIENIIKAVNCLE